MSVAGTVDVVVRITPETVAPKTMDPATVNTMSRVLGDAMHSEFAGVTVTPPVKSIEVTRTASAGKGEAIIKSPMPDSSKLFNLASTPIYRLRVEIEIDDPKVSGFNTHVFTGHINKAVQDENGIVEMTAFDHGITLNRHTVELDTEEPVETTTLARELLVSDGPLEADDVIIGFQDPVGEESTNPYSDWYGTTGEYPSARLAPVDVNVSIGLDQRVRLFDALKEIAKRQHAFLYIDARNRVHFVEQPPVARKGKPWNLDRITKISTGEQEEANQKVLLESPEPSPVQFGSVQADSAVTEVANRDLVQQGIDAVNNIIGYTQTTPIIDPATGDVETAGDAYRKLNNPPKKNIQDNNVSSITEQQNIGIDKWVSDSMVSTTGTVTMIGDGRITPFDRVRISDLPDFVDLPAGTYTVSEVKNIINTDDGYITKLKLVDDLVDVYGRLTDTIGRTNKIVEIVDPEKGDSTPEPDESDSPTSAPPADDSSNDDDGDNPRDDPDFGPGFG